MIRRQRWADYGEALAGVALVTLACWLLITYSILAERVIPITVGFGYLLAVIVTASRRGLGPSIFASVVGMWCFDFFFLPPIHHVDLLDPHWMAFMVTAGIAIWLWSGSLQAQLQARASRDMLMKLYRLSCSIISALDPAELTASIAPRVLEVFGHDYCGVFQKDEEGWRCLSAADASAVASSFRPASEEMECVYRTGKILSIRTFLSPQKGSGQSRVATYVAAKAGEKVIAVLVLVDTLAQAETVEAIASLVALSLERARLLREIRVKDALKKSDELKSALLASVSHNLRTPLTSIKASVDSILAVQDSRGDSTVRELHLIISEEVSRLSRIVDRLLEMARVEAGQPQPQKEWTSVTEILDNALVSCGASLRHHKLRAEGADELPLVNVDPRMLTEVLANLIENAAKYSPAGTEITVHADLDSDSLRVSVVDQGPGVAMEDRERIFEKFYRGTLPPQQSQAGTGMGLAIARGLVRAHSGKIWVESSSEHGSTFVFCVPAEHGKPVNSAVPVNER